MNDQNETTASPSEPKLCKMGCGFFGSNATGDCCSKCYNEILKKEGASASPVAAPAPTQQPSTPTVAATTAAPTTTTVATTTAVEPTTVAEPQKKKKKKKKISYKNMMAGMMEQNGPRDAEKEKEGIKKVTGGGAFSKIDKI